MPGELLHESVAELADLVVGAALGVEVGSTVKVDKSAFGSHHRGDVAETHPFPPPMLRPVRAFLKICSNPRLKRKYGVR